MRFIWPPRAGCTSSRQSIDPQLRPMRAIAAVAPVIVLRRQRRGGGMLAAPPVYCRSHHCRPGGTRSASNCPPDAPCVSSSRWRSRTKGESSRCSTTRASRWTVCRTPGTRRAIQAGRSSSDRLVAAGRTELGPPFVAPLTTCRGGGFPMPHLPAKRRRGLSMVIG